MNDKIFPYAHFLFLFLAENNKKKSLILQNRFIQLFFSFHFFFFFACPFACVTHVCMELSVTSRAQLHEAHRIFRAEENAGCKETVCHVLIVLYKRTRSEKHESKFFYTRAKI